MDKCNNNKDLCAKPFAVAYFYNGGWFAERFATADEAIEEARQARAHGAREIKAVNGLNGKRIRF